MPLDSGIPEPREFVYLDEESINSHLSSMGVGIATDARTETDSEEESKGRLRAILPLFTGAGGGEISRRNLDSEHYQQQIKLTAPYRFDQLQAEFDSAGIEVKNPEEEGASAGDVVQIEGTVEALSLFRIELHDDAISSLGDAFNEAAETVVDSPEVEEDLVEKLGQIGEKSKGNKATASMAKRLYADRVPVRLDNKNQSYAIPLRRKSCRVPLSHAFSSPRPYTVFGRIEGRIKSGDSWRPGDMFRTLQSLSTGEPAKEFDNAIREIGKGRDIEIDSRHLEVEGPAKIVHPIAIWW